MKKKTILSLDSSYNSCSVALQINKKLDFIFDKCENNYEEKIFPMIKKIIKRNYITPYNLDIIAYSNGPGSFSGIRLSASISQSFFFNKKVQLISISSLKIIAENCWKKYKKKKLIILIKKKNKNFFYGKYYRKKNGIWKKKNSEKLINIKEVIRKILKCKNITISGNFCKKELKKELYKKKYKIKICYFLIKFPNAKYTISIVKKILKNTVYRKNLEKKLLYL
ncbi:tRNA (adenosine(37)-N6)-threonylcarbamoyltransferase complex dimerization subunit type 1 TsaB [Buchnera aphidicola (Chaitoregma tattakana)]|uniref:tRNA (adenosine(37)-N6)-threonylcarbamoyltransferase complex dimerization subunit type 1 TsaB n=1 Tax=Buchnera aphidicola TaxID=9 RepID=UPI0031B8A9D4